MVVNLFQNAVTHGKEGNEICVGLDRDAHIVRLTVADTGPGIPEAARNDVFEPFHRLDPSRRKPGSGLGLALVRAIAERHGARITLADNAPGLRVTVEFGAAIETNH
jgi:signal transduction histidine kinase